MSDTLFTMGPTYVDSLLATTLSNIREELTEEVFNSNPTFAYLNSKGRAILDGGASIVEPLMYGKNTTAQAYDGFDILDTTPQGGLTAAQFKWKQYSVTVSVSGRESEIQNTGKEQAINLITSKVQQATMSLEDRLAIDLFAATQSTKKIGTLVTLIDATSTVGDINSTSNSFWQATVTASGSFAAQGVSDMRTTWNTISIYKPKGMADFLVSDQTTYERYEATVLPHLRIQNEQLGDLGFTNLKFKGATYAYDANATSGVIYFLNSKNLKLCVHKNRNFAAGSFIEPTNQDAKTKKILWAGEMVVNSRRKLGKNTSVSA